MEAVVRDGIWQATLIDFERVRHHIVTISVNIMWHDSDTVHYMAYEDGTPRNPVGENCVNTVSIFRDDVP